MTTIARLTELLAVADLECLIASGGTRSEYRHEASAISARLGGCDNAADVKHVVASVFAAEFGRCSLATVDGIAAVADEIWKFTASTSSGTKKKSA